MEPPREGTINSQKNQSGTALKTQVRERTGCHMAAAPVPVLPPPGNPLKKKGTPDTANIPERWRGRSSRTTWGRATAGKQSSQLGCGPRPTFTSRNKDADASKDQK